VTKALDNPVASAKVAQRLEKRNSIVEIVPNPFGGVNTHLWRNKAYIIGIASIVRPAYSLQRSNGKEQEGRGLIVWFSISKENIACYQSENSELSSS
jgi:hypothetical protein